VQDPQEVRARERVGALLRGKWKLDRLLGVGGMAAVYAATHRNGRRGAVKILHADVAREADAQRRFVREGYVANAIDHPGVVAVLDDDVSEDGCAFLVMELLRGQEVGKLVQLRPDQRLSIDEVLFIADEVLGALDAAHAKGVVHRDLKPENLFLTEDRRLKILDFGIARLRDGVHDASKTSTGSMMGTPAYMPPEQALGEWNRVDARSDVWALGATMFELLTGDCVHPAQNVQKMLLAAMTHHARPIRSLAPTLPLDVAAIVDRSLAFEPEARFQSAAEMQAAVRGARRAFPRPEFAGFTPANADAGPRSSMTPAPDAGPSSRAAAPSSAGPGEAARARTFVSDGPDAPSFAPIHGTLKPSSSDPLRRSPSSARPFLAIGGGLAVVAAVVGGILLYKARDAASATAPIASETATPPTDTGPAPTPALTMTITATSSEPASSAAPSAAAALSVSSAPTEVGAAPPPASSPAKSNPPVTTHVGPPRPSTTPAAPPNTGKTTGTDTKYGL